MSRSVEAWTGKTDDSAIPRRVKLRVWDREQGRCHRCSRKSPVGDAWIIEHRIALINGGANAEPNLCLSCSWCKPLKDAEDVAEKVETYRVRSKHVLPKGPSRLQSRGFPKSPPQHTASRPLRKAAEK
jgi:5-methylcytosine-specific restriction endonuclease McrA